MDLIPIGITHVINGHVLLRRLFVRIFADISFIEQLLAESGWTLVVNLYAGSGEVRIL